MYYAVLTILMFNNFAFELILVKELYSVHDSLIPPSPVALEFSFNEAVYMVVESDEMGELYVVKKGSNKIPVHVKIVGELQTQFGGIVSDITLTFQPHVTKLPVKFHIHNNNIGLEKLAIVAIELQLPEYEHSAHIDSLFGIASVEALDDDGNSLLQSLGFLLCIVLLQRS